MSLNIQTFINRNSLNNNINSNVNNPPVDYNNKPDLTSQDEFVSSKSKQQDKKKHKFLFPLAITATFAGIMGAIALFTKGKTFNPACFASKIDFTKAQSIDEAQKFAKSNFNISEFNLDDLEIANWVNEGLVNINNRFKGQAQMPSVIRWASTQDKLTDGALAAYSMDNSLIFSKNALKKENLLKNFLDDTSLLFKKDDKGKTLIHTYPIYDSRKLAQIAPVWEKATNNSEEISRFELLEAKFKLEDAVYSSISPRAALNNILNNKKLSDLFKEKNISVDTAKFNKMNSKEQFDYLNNLCKQAGIKFIHGGGTTRSNSVFDVIYHEMGHAQHFANISIYDSMWGKLSEKSTQKFINDLEKQNIASSISWYAQTDPKELIAEMFSAIISGKKFDDKTMELYKYYKGPVIPSI